MPPDVKFCGLTRAEDVDSAVELGASYLGFVFATSPRRTTPSQVRAMSQQLPSGPARVGVFAHATREEILNAVEVASLHVVQLHDSSLLPLAPDLRARGVAVWSVVYVVDGRLSSNAQEVAGLVDAIVVDTRVGKRLGGTGVPFDWVAAREELRHVRATTRLAVAGGLRPDNVGEAIRTLAPDIVDVSSGVEAQPGIKDRRQMRAFMQAVREASLT